MALRISLTSFNGARVSRKAKVGVVIWFVVFFIIIAASIGVTFFQIVNLKNLQRFPGIMVQIPKMSGDQYATLFRSQDGNATALLDSFGLLGKQRNNYTVLFNELSYITVEANGTRSSQNLRFQGGNKNSNSATYETVADLVLLQNLNSTVAITLQKYGQIYPPVAFNGETMSLRSLQTPFVFFGAFHVALIALSGWPVLYVPGTYFQQEPKGAPNKSKKILLYAYIGFIFLGMVYPLFTIGYFATRETLMDSALGTLNSIDGLVASRQPHSSILEWLAFITTVLYIFLLLLCGIMFHSLGAVYFNRANNDFTWSVQFDDFGPDLDNNIASTKVSYSDPLIGFKKKNQYRADDL